MPRAAVMLGIWDEAMALLAGLAFVAQEGRVPKANECRASQQLPNQGTVQRLFGSISAYQQRLVQDGAAYLRTPPKVQRDCLRCGRPVRSANPLQYVCYGCKQTVGYQQDDMDWMNGEVRGRGWT